MDVRHLEALLAVVDENGFAAAARSLQIGRSTLTERIQALEREVGKRLVHRSPVRLTPAGRLFEPPARRSVREMRAALTALDGVARVGHDSLRVGLMAGGAAELNVPLFRLLARTLPSVAISFVDLAWYDTELAVLDGSVDVAIIRSPVGHPNLATVQLFLNERVAMMMSTHPLATATSLSVADLADTALTGVDPRQSSAFRDFFLLRDERNGELPARVLSASGFGDALFHMINHGAVATPSADAGRVLFAPAVRAIPLRDAAPSGAVAIRRRDDRRAPVLAFMRAAEHVAGTCQSLVPGSLPMTGH